MKTKKPVKKDQPKRSHKKKVPAEDPLKESTIAKLQGDLSEKLDKMEKVLDLQNRIISKLKQFIAVLGA